MDLYTETAYHMSKYLTRRYSTSFSTSSRLFDAAIQKDIYAIYALVRIADEIVDTYTGDDAGERLATLESEVYTGLHTGYSANVVVHAFVQTAKKYGITKTLIAPFFQSMALDLAPHTYNDSLYRQYIHGSAEVVGLMCLRVFVNNDAALYKQLYPGAIALGSAYQKVNFLRDVAADYKVLGRLYFPGVTYETLDEAAKQAIITDIKNDFTTALPSLEALPASAKKATTMSYVYYTELLKKLERTPMSVIKQQRISVPNYRKMALLIKTILRGTVPHV